MTNEQRRNRRHASIWSALISIALLLGFDVIAEEAQDIEEIVVTGSYLKRTAQDSPSPLSVVTSADIEDLGATDVSEIIQAMPWSSGSQTRAATFQGEGADGRNSINLRNLGHGATLPLVNGKRQVASWYNGRGNASVNVNGLIPNIAIERIEIVKDGASALYGADAVAGVVNFITKRDFEGFDFSYQWSTDEDTREGDTAQMGIIYGVQGDRGGIVASASFLNREEINVDDNYDRFGGTTVSSTGQPGRLTPIAGQDIIWATGPFEGLAVDRATQFPDATGSGNLPRNRLGTDFGEADVNCEDAAALERGGALGNIFNRCIYDFGSFFAIQGEESLRKMHVDGHYNITDSIEAYFEFAANDSEFDRLNSLNPNAPALTIPVSVDYIDANGMVQSRANPGSVEDAFRRGIEPIEYANITRLLGGTRNTPKDRRPLDTFTNANRSDQRYMLGAVWDFEIGERSWSLDASYTASQHSTAQSESQDTLSSHMELALSGLGGPNCNKISGIPGEGNFAYAGLNPDGTANALLTPGNFDNGNCYFFNPFGNARFDRSGNLGQNDLRLVNPAELYSWLLGRFTYDLDFRQRVIDVVGSGDLIETDWGPVGLALGFQRRKDSGAAVFDGAVNANNLDFAFGAQDWDASLTTTAFFAELGVPIGDTLEVNVAVRYEDFDEIGKDSTDPKVTILWRPTESLSLRASGGSSYKVPSLQQLFGSQTTVANQADLVGGTAFKPSLSVGNPELSPESADTLNFGITWAPQEGALEGLSIDVDYYDYDYKDIITRESSATLLAEDNAAIQAYVDANPGAGFAEAALNADRNFDQIIRNGQGILLRILPEYANANGADISGIDLNASYTFDTEIGTWRVGLQTAWVDEYSVEVPNSAGGTTKFDAVGNYNETNPVARPLPEYKLSGTLSWNYNQHRAFLIVKHTDDLESDVPAGTRGFFRATAALAGNDRVANDLNDTKIESFTTADLQYTYTFDNARWLSNAQVTVGVQNVFDEEAPVVAAVTAFNGTLHDGRGRIWMLRFGGSL